MTVDRYFTMSRIEREAEAILRSFGVDGQSLSNAPVPADEILECHLGLSLDFDDLQKHGSRGALGALYVQTKEVFVDEKLDPHLYPKNRGRFNFTVAHEIGHWQLHKDGERAETEPAVGTIDEFHVCAEQQDPQLEWEANYFAACLLMPRLMVEAAWVKAGGRLDHGIVFDPEKHPRQRRRRRYGLVSVETIVNDLLEPPENYLFNKIAAEIAPTFNVSTEAMRIRLQNLGLLIGQTLNPEERLLRLLFRLSKS